MLARNKARISYSLFLLVLNISISTHLFIHLTTQKKKTKCIQNIYRYIVKNIKKRRFFFYIVREENIRPQVLRDKISPPFFQHYGKKISYRIHRYYLQLKHWLASQNHKNESIIDLVLHCMCMTVVPCTKVLKDFSSVWFYKIFEYYQHLPKMAPL